MNNQQKINNNTAAIKKALGNEGLRGDLSQTFKDGARCFDISGYDKESDRFIHCVVIIHGVNDDGFFVVENSNTPPTQLTTTLKEWLLPYPRFGG